MSSYRLYVLDDNDKSAIWTHTAGHGGKACLYFPDDKDVVIVLEHDTQTTHLYISPDGILEIEVIPPDR